MISIEFVLSGVNCSDHPIGIDTNILEGAETIYAAGGCNCYPCSPEGKTCESYCDSGSFGIGKLRDGRYIAAQENSDSSGHG